MFEWIPNTRPAGDQESSREDALANLHVLNPCMYACLWLVLAKLVATGLFEEETVVSFAHVSQVILNKMSHP
jgi:hypothetical protein